MFRYTFICLFLLLALASFALAQPVPQSAQKKSPDPHEIISKQLKNYPELKYYKEEIQIHPSHIIEVLKAVHQHKEPKILIWGVGHDSRMWCEAGQGKTIFIEDSKFWADRTATEISCRIAMVQYQTKRKDWKKLLQEPNKLVLELPDDIKNKKFDIIVVDAPAGYNGKVPGRMKSIYMSAEKLSHSKSNIYVDDYKRVVEKTYAEKFLTPRFGSPRVFNERSGFACYGK